MQSTINVPVGNIWHPCIRCGKESAPPPYIVCHTCAPRTTGFPVAQRRHFGSDCGCVRDRLRVTPFHPARTASFVPMVADVFVTMKAFGLTQDEAVRWLGGVP